MNRRGSVLIIVVGLSALLLTLFLVINRQLRSEVDDGLLVQQEMQARMMLGGALAFILESGRLGNHNDVECFGWTDVRDGGVGPRGPTLPDGSLPPDVSGNTWPAPGSTYRADMTAWVRPPMAVRPIGAHNPITMPKAWLEEYEAASDPGTTYLKKIISPIEGNGTDIGEVPAETEYRDGKDWYWTKGSNKILSNKGMTTHWERVWSALFDDLRDFEPRYHQMLQPQPVADSLSEFEDGDKRPDLRSADLAWFRVYRELPSDHDGNNQPDFDRMALSGHGVFIITCGAGGTRGYRDWSEVTADGAADVFMNDQSFFEDLRKQERILWYRAEWTGFVGGGFDAQHMLIQIGSNGSRRRNFTNVLTQRSYIDANPLPNSTMPLVNVTGCFKWIQRLEAEPTDAAGDPIW